MLCFLLLNNLPWIPFILKRFFEARPCSMQNCGLKNEGRINIFIQGGMALTMQQEVSHVKQSKSGE